MGEFTATPKTWAVDDYITADALNANLRDFVNAFGAWTTYSPTVTQGASTVSRTANYAKYSRIKSHVWVQLRLTLTSNSSDSGPVTITLPVTAATTSLTVGSGLYYNNDGSRYKVIALTQTTGTVRLYVTSNTEDDQIGSSPNISASTSDEIALNLHYEAA